MPSRSSAFFFAKYVIIAVGIVLVYLGGEALRRPMVRWTSHEEWSSFITQCPAEELRISSITFPVGIDPRWIIHLTINFKTQGITVQQEQYEDRYGPFWNYDWHYTGPSPLLMDFNAHPSPYYRDAQIAAIRNALSVLGPPTLPTRSGSRRVTVAFWKAGKLCTFSYMAPDPAFMKLAHVLELRSVIGTELFP